jgi:hypothetical protein
MKIFAVCLLLSAWMTAAFAAPPTDGTPSAAPAPDSLVFSGSFDRYSPGSLGSNGSVDWVHASGADRTYTLGFGVYSVDTSRWSFAKLGAAYHWNARTTFQGLASVGGGHTDGDGFGYQIYDGSITYKATPRIYVRFGDQLFQIAGSRGHLLKPGLLLVPARRVQADLTYAHSVGGDVGNQFVSGRIDFTARAFHLLGGFSFGYSTPQRLSLDFGGPPVAQNFQEGFFGVGVPLSKTVLSIVADVLDADTNRRSVTIIWKVPIGKRGSQRP